MSERDPDLCAEDIATEMGFSVSKAYEIMKEMPRIKHGNTTRVTRAAFNKWRADHTVPPCRESIEQITATTITSFAEKEKASKRRTGKPRTSQLATESGATLIRHTQPRTKPRSARRCSNTSTSSDSDERPRRH